MSEKFTPGTWTYALDGHGAYSIDSFSVDGRSVQICFVRSEANAALIADAPAMYELLQRIADKNSCWINNDLLNEVDALLARHQS